LRLPFDPFLLINSRIDALIADLGVESATNCEWGMIARYSAQFSPAFFKERFIPL